MSVEPSKNLSLVLEFNEVRRKSVERKLDDDSKRRTRQLDNLGCTPNTHHLASMVSIVVFQDADHCYESLMRQRSRVEDRGYCKLSVIDEKQNISILVIDMCTTLLSAVCSHAVDRYY